MNKLKEEVIWVDSEKGKDELLPVVKETKIEEDLSVEETKKEGIDKEETEVVTAGTFGFQVEVVKSKEESMVGS